MKNKPLHDFCCANVTITIYSNCLDEMMLWDSNVTISARNISRNIFRNPIDKLLKFIILQVNQLMNCVGAFCIYTVFDVAANLLATDLDLKDDIGSARDFGGSSRGSSMHRGMSLDRSFGEHGSFRVSSRHWQLF